MDKLDYLDELEIMVRTGEIKTSALPEDGAAILGDIKRIVTENMCQEIENDITDPFTCSYYPDFPTWKHLLNFYNGYKDYNKILNEMYTEKELDILWNNSHCIQFNNDEQIKEQLIKQICNLKMRSMVSQSLKVNPEQCRISKMATVAMIKGLYSRLYEGKG